MIEKANILFLSPEAVPFAKSGGLADVAGSLPSALKRFGLDVRMVIPYYRTIKDGAFDVRLLLKGMKVPLGEGRLETHIFETSTEDQIPVYLLEREDLYDRPHLYGNERGDYYDNLERFTFFAHAALRLTEALSFRPDVIHCHDWQTGLVPALLKGPYKGSRGFLKTSTLFTIHNMGYQGIFPASRLPITGIPIKDFFHPEGLEYWGKVSLLKAGIVYSDAITTVSPTYALEIQSPEYGMGMEGILKGRREFLHGILNGIDYDQWNPAKDSHIAVPYSPEGMTGKGECKASLIQEMNLDPHLRSRPLIGMISRLDAQKGLDILLEILDDMLALDIGLVVLGSGDEVIEFVVKEAAGRHQGKVGIHLGFNEPLAHQIIAGADMFLVPSRYEPCGLTQMYALKYGTVPVVRATGGLNDTISQFDPQTGKGSGFKFGPYTSEAFLAAVRQAVKIFDDPETWKVLMANGMNEDFSWERSASQYMHLYRSITPMDRSTHEGA